ncbi:MAG: PAQR family membrane homeostasis protein TrhA [Fusobacteriaceae bacterium]
MSDTYSRVEEWMNSMTHYVGVVLGLVGLGALIVHSIGTNNTGYLIGCMIFSFSIILLYSMSGTYHILKNGKAKKVFQILDHSAIYILISGSYTPYLLGVFQGNTKWIFFGIQWGLTLVGIIFKIFFTGRFEFLSTVIYLVMGWMIMFVYKDLKAFTNTTSINFLISGGISYSVGVIFYIWKNLKFAHAIWHLFVLTGSIFIYLSVYSIY